MLVEADRPADAGILVGADEALLERYLPAGGINRPINVFLIKAHGKNILVDAGLNGSFIEKMMSLGVTPDQIDAILITHLHGDHFGALQKDGRAVFPKAKIYLSAREHNYWTRDASVNPQQAESVKAALAPYSSRIETFEPQAAGSTLRELLPGITPIAAYGHTPGHTVFLIENSGSRLLIIGDLLHLEYVQFPVPGISATFDMDKDASAAIRREILNYAARNRMPVGGIHIVYPGIGTVEADGDGFK
jgi:glyoxylase-like metal-dependent hydrolase (beta-lactamase superfamily II)